MSANNNDFHLVWVCDVVYIIFSLLFCFVSRHLFSLYIGNSLENDSSFHIRFVALSLSLPFISVTVRTKKMTATTQCECVCAVCVVCVVCAVCVWSNASMTIWWQKRQHEHTQLHSHFGIRKSLSASLTSNGKRHP